MLNLGRLCTFFKIVHINNIIIDSEVMVIDILTDIQIKKLTYEKINKTTYKNFLRKEKMKKLL